MIRNFYNSSNSGKFQIVKEIRKFDSVEIVYSVDKNETCRIDDIVVIF